MSWKNCIACVEGRCPFGYGNVRRRENNKGHKGYSAPRGDSKPQEVFTMAMKRAVPSMNDATDGKPDICNMAENFASLWEFLVEDEWDDGKRRVPGTIMLFREEQQFKAMLNDKDAGRIAFCSADSLETLLSVVDLGLRDSRLDWRKSKAFKK